MTYTIKENKDFKSMKKNITLTIIIGLLSPFLILPLIGLFLKFTIFIGDHSPDWLIIFRISSISEISYSNYIYYYITFLAMEVTGFLSYAIYKLTIQKDLREIELINFEKNSRYIKTLHDILLELEQNQKEYSLERNDTKWSFKQIIEDENKTQYSYNDLNKSFTFNVWNNNNSTFLLIMKDIKKEKLYTRTTNVISLLKEITEKNDINQLELDDYKSFNKSLSKVISELKEIIENFSRQI